MLSDHDLRQLETECPSATGSLLMIAHLFSLILGREVSLDDAQNALERLHARNPQPKTQTTRLTTFDSLDL